MNGIQAFIEQEILLKLFIALILSLIIGFERELKKKPVGLKTSMVIACFSCLLTIISIETAYSTPGRDDISITMDPLRLAAQIVSGIGFLGAGVILRRGNDTITGLTTAAMIWGAGAIGIAVGAGFYLYATLTVIAVIIGIEVLSPMVIKYGPSRLRFQEGTLVISVEDISDLHQLKDFLLQQNIQIINYSLKDTLSFDMIVHEATIRFISDNSSNKLELYSQITALAYVKKASLEFLH